MHLQRKLRLMAAIIGTAGLLGTAHASYSDLVFFGDSLSDTGNVLSLTTAFAPTPYPTYPGAEGRFSNGPVWTEYLAAGLGFPASAAPSNLMLVGPPVISSPAVMLIGAPGGQNYAFGGARTGLGGSAGPTTGLLGQLVAWNGNLFASSLTRPADPNALYVIVAGANDLRDARSANPLATPEDATARAAAASATAQGVINTVALLAQAGAQHFLISNLPDLGRTPEAVALGVVDASTDVTLMFNSALAAYATGLDSFFLTNFAVDLDIRMMDFFGLTNAIFDDATLNGGALYGITNVSVPCIAPGLYSSEYFFADATDINCSISAFSDPLHPSAAVHQLVGRLALNTVPEPASFALIAMALFAMAWMRRRQRIGS